MRTKSFKVCVVKKKNLFIIYYTKRIITKIDSKMITSIEDVSTKGNMVNVLMIGTGEYTTGYVPSKGDDNAPQSDKSSGVVALTIFDCKRRHKVNRIGMCGINGTKFPQIRNHMKERIVNTYRNMDYMNLLETYPNDNTIDPNAYKNAILQYNAGDIAIIFTPDHTHYEIAIECIQHGMHVMITKPIVQTLQQHISLISLAKQYNVLVVIEVHKRYDPFYIDIHDRIRAKKDIGNDFQYMYSYMSQPKHQLDTFSAWLGGSGGSNSSDISYYLNSHHIDWCEWTLHQIARPIRVTAIASNGIANQKFDTDSIEDSITLTVQWENNNTNKTLGVGIYTSSWVAPISDVHSQQRFFYMGSNGEVNIDQAHRGCTLSSDTSKTGLQSINPLFMKYTPDSNGYFAGQSCYGVRSIEYFIDCCNLIQQGEKTVLNDYSNNYNISLATVDTTLQTTAILHAGRMSLDLQSQPIDILYHDHMDNNQCHIFYDQPIELRPHFFPTPPTTNTNTTTSTTTSES